MKVYIKVNENNVITSINSEMFLSDTTDWLLIDEGDGDNFTHAQGNYLDKPIIDEYGVYQYKYENGEIVERTLEERKADIQEIEILPTELERIEALEEAMLELLGGMLND